MAAVISRKNITHSVAQPQTKWLISHFVPTGWINPMVTQMATPVTAPNTRVSRTKNRE